MILACTLIQLKWIRHRNWMMTVHCLQPVALERGRSQCHIFNICWLVFRWDKSSSNVLRHTNITIKYTILDMYLKIMKKLIFYAFAGVYILNFLCTFIPLSFIFNNLVFYLRIHFVAFQSGALYFYVRSTRFVWFHFFPIICFSVYISFLWKFTSFDLCYQCGMFVFFCFFISISILLDLILSARIWFVCRLVITLVFAFAPSQFLYPQLHMKWETTF